MLKSIANTFLHINMYYLLYKSQINYKGWIPWKQGKRSKGDNIGQTAQCQVMNFRRKPVKCHAASRIYTIITTHIRQVSDELFDFVFDNK